MKKTLVFLFLIAATTLTFAQTVQQKTGWVNFQSIMQQYPLAIKAQSDLDVYVSKKTRELDSMKVALQNDYANYQKQAATMTPEAKKTMEQDITAKSQALEQYQQKIFAQPNGEVYMKNEELFTPIKEKIFAAIEAIAKEEGMKYVLDRSTEAIVIYADTEFDITYKVLDRLNRKK